jgi:hypothetical protein
VPRPINLSIRPKFNHDIACIALSTSKLSRKETVECSHSWHSSPCPQQTKSIKGAVIEFLLREQTAGTDTQRYFKIPALGLWSVSGAAVRRFNNSDHFGSCGAQLSFPCFAGGARAATRWAIFITSTGHLALTFPSTCPYQFSAKSKPTK